MKTRTQTASSRPESDKGLKEVPCQHYKDCGGCPFIRFDYKTQLLKKHAMVLEAFQDLGYDMKLIKRITKPTRPSPQTLGYRNKAKWVLQRDAVTNRIKMGIYYPGTHEVVDIPSCAVHAPLINQVSLSIKQSLEEHGVSVDAHDTSEPNLRYVIVRYSFREKKCIVVFVTTTKSVPGLESVFSDLTKKYPTELVSIVQNINHSDGNVLLGEANRFVTKNKELSESMGPMRVPMGALSFLQVNSRQAPFLYKRVRELMGNGPFEVGLDLYSGVGLFAMHMSSSTDTIVAVEEMGSAVLEAMTACRRNKIQNIMPVCADAMEGLRVFTSEYRSPDWVVINPPRKGCEEGLMDALAKIEIGKMAYISCNPRTLARDLKILCKANPGIKIKSIEPVDMFPQTAHVECIAYLENTQRKSLVPERSPVSEKSGKRSQKKRSIH